MAFIRSVAPSTDLACAPPGVLLCCFREAYHNRKTVIQVLANLHTAGVRRILGYHPGGGHSGRQYRPATQGHRHSWQADAVSKARRMQVTGSHHYRPGVLGRVAFLQLRDSGEGFRGTHTNGTKLSPFSMSLPN